MNYITIDNEIDSLYVLSQLPAVYWYEASTPFKSSPLQIIGGSYSLLQKAQCLEAPRWMV